MDFLKAVPIPQRRSPGSRLQSREHAELMLSVQRRRNVEWLSHLAKTFTGELQLDRKYVEGAVKQVIVNRYERDTKARAVCLSEFGYTCEVCGMSFAQRYGKIGERFIHVHHRNPLALRKNKYELNPKTDLVPVCPNCHAMLHATDPPLTTDELRKMMEDAGSL